MASKKNKPSKARVKTAGKVVKPIEVFTNESHLNIGTVSMSYQWLFYSLLLIFSVILIYGAIRVRVAADEPIDYEYGKAALNYFTTFGKDSSYAHLAVYKSKFPNQKYYGAFVEIIAPAINKLVPGINGIKAHHIISAFFCVVLLFFTGQLARITINNRAAVLALLLLGLTPEILGNGFFNTKDIPFAAAYIMSIYFSVRLFQSFPQLNWRLIAGWLLSLALAIAVRVGGIVLIPLIGCFALFIVLTTPTVRKTSLKIKFRWFRVLLASVFIAVVLAGITYPNFWHMGFSHFSKALENFKQFPAKIFMLYDGELILSTNIDTGFFLLNYIWISFPEIVLLLTVIGSVLLLSAPLIKKPVGWFILLAAWFPVIYIIAINAFIYNGWRHVMFAYPCMIIISVYVLSYFYEKFKSSVVIKSVITVILLLSVADLSAYNIEAFPYNYFYFNHMEGGVEGAYNNYDLDYQQLATTDAFDWLKSHTDISKRDSSTLLFSNNPLSLLYYVKDTAKYKLLQTGLVDMYEIKWDYAIVSNNFQPVKFIKFAYPPKGTIYTVNRFGVPLAYVVKRQSVKYLDSIYLGHEGKYDELLPILQEEYKSNPANLSNMYSLAFCYYKKNNYDESLRLLDTIAKYNAKRNLVQELYAYDYYNKKEYEKAIGYIRTIYKTNPNNLAYNQILYNSLMSLGHKKAAQRYFVRMQQEEQASTK